MRGYQATAIKGVVIAAEDLREFVMCPYTILTRYIDGVNIKEPKRLSLEALHKVHYIIHRFGAQSAHKVVVAAKQTKNKKILNFLTELSEMIEVHKDEKPTDEFFENVEIKSLELGLSGTIPLVYKTIPILEYFKINAQIGEIPIWDKVLLTAYTLLLEYYNETDVNYGLIEYTYKNLQVKIEITDVLREKTFRYHQWMIKTMRTGKYPFNYVVDPLKCSRCLYATECQYK